MIVEFQDYGFKKKSIEYLYNLNLMILKSCRRDENDQVLYTSRELL